jgi:hypothetical protein
MDMRGENAEYVGITKDGVAFLERPVILDFRIKSL